MPAETHGVQRALEVALWAVPAGLAAWRFLRERRGERSGWLVIGGACATIAADKGVDLLAIAMPLLREAAWALDPETSSKGSNPLLRLALVAGVALAVLLGLWVVARRDRRLDGPKRTGLLGLALVVAYLGVRQLLGPDGLPPTAAWAWELGAWALVLVGTLRGGRRGTVANAG